MTSIGRNELPRIVLGAAVVIAFGFEAGCATHAVRRTTDADAGEAAQPTCQPVDVAPGRRPIAPMADGCWNEANLARMVADPRDLTRGRGLGPADGSREALAVEKYRRGQVKPLEGQDSTGFAVQAPIALGVAGP